MSNLQYIGARYVPKFYLNPDYPAGDTRTNDWKSGVDYEALMIVTYNNDSYTSKKPVPDTIGNPLDNPEYWVCTTKYTAALVALQTTVGQHETRIDSLEYVADGIVTPEMFGAVGDGVNDDTDAINTAIQSGNVVLFGKNKNYKVTGSPYAGYVVGLKVNRSVILDFNGAKLTIDKGNNAYVFGIYVSGNNITLKNPHVIGDIAADAASITYTDSHGICVKNANNITIINPVIEQVSGDGIYISNVSKFEMPGLARFNKIGRNGISIIDCDGAMIDTVYGTDIKYNAPFTLIDIEPNEYTQNTIGIEIAKAIAIDCVSNLHTVGVGGQLSAHIGTVIADSCSGVAYSANYIIANDTGTQVHVNDDNKVIIDNVITINMKNNIISLKNTNASKMPFISVRNVAAYNYSADNSGGSIAYSDALVYYLQAAGVTGFDHHGNFEVLNIHVDDADILPLTIRDNISGHPDDIDNVLVEVKSPVHNDISNNGTFKGILDITPPPFDFGVIPDGGTDSATYQMLVDKLLDYSYGDYIISGRIATKGTDGSGAAKIRSNNSIGSAAHFISDQYLCNLRIYTGGTFRAYETVGTAVV